MSRRWILAVAAMTLALGVAPLASASHDHNADPQRCDTWWRQNHQSGSGSATTSHNHSDGSDIVVGDPAHTVIHAHQGHYVFRNDFMYFEVVGGQTYKGPDPSGNNYPGQGGYVQGEIDPVAGAPDGDFNVAFFGPDADNPPGATPPAVQQWVNGSYGKGCANAAGTQVEQQTREP